MSKGGVAVKYRSGNLAPGEVRQWLSEGRAKRKVGIAQAEDISHIPRPFSEPDFDTNTQRLMPDTRVSSNLTFGNAEYQSF